MLYNKALLSRSLNTHTQYIHAVFFFNSLNISDRMSVCVSTTNEGFPLMKFIATIRDKMLF